MYYDQELEEPLLQDVELEDVGTIEEDEWLVVDLENESLDQIPNLPERLRQFLEQSGLSEEDLARVNLSHDPEKTKSKRATRLPNEWTCQELSQKATIPKSTLYTWMRKGLLQVRRVEKENIWLITADEQEVKRLQNLKNQPKQWIYHSRVKKIN